jgi:hypothetical protein
MRKAVFSLSVVRAEAKEIIEHRKSATWLNQVAAFQWMRLTLRFI